MDAVLLAAGRSGDDFSEAFSTEHKCLVRVAGRPIIRWVLDALRASPLIGRVIVIGPEQPLRSAGVAEEIIPNEDGSYADSVAAGLRAATGDRVLIIAADVPLLKSGALDRYIADCLRTDADVCFPVVSWEAMQDRLPGARKTWYDLRDGKYTKGNAVVVRREVVLQRLDRVESLFKTRKKKQWAALVCQGFMSRLLRCIATRSEVEAGLSTYLGLRVKAVDADPAIAVDVDEVTDVPFVGQVLAGGNSPQGGRLARTPTTQPRLLHGLAARTV